jgi:putative MFS transporter
MEPWQFAVLLILSGSLSIPGASISGRLCDRYGRRPVGCISLITFAICTWGFFRGPDWAMYAAAIPMMYSAISGNVVIMALSSELFPTDLRGTSSGSVMILGATGAGTGLLSVGALTLSAGDIVIFVPILALATVASAFLMLYLPETKALELEEISWTEADPQVTVNLDPPLSGAHATGVAGLRMPSAAFHSSETPIQQ